MTTIAVDRRAAELFEERKSGNYRRTSRIFALLMAGQWIFAIVIALVFSPYAWEGKHTAIHAHVWIAIFLGGALSSLPIYLTLTQPTSALTRNVVAVAQMLWSAVLIHLSGGRIETHFHVFGSLAFVAFYRDWKVLLPATVVVAADHLARQMFWPESVYGIVNPEWWRFIEHAFWVVFEDIVLIAACLLSVEEMRTTSRAQAEVEELSARERGKSDALNQVLEELQTSQEQLVRAEKLAAVGQLAASVGHELRNPLAAVRNASTYIGKRLRDGGNGNGSAEPRVRQFLDIMDRELEVCAKIINDLLDFARERPIRARPCPLGALAAEAIALVPPSSVEVAIDMAADLAVPNLDPDQFRQVLINLVQNGVEALEGREGGRVVLRASRGGGQWRLTVSDNGPGVPADAAARIFEPLYTTKAKGTGLGLAIVSAAVRRHGGTIRVESGDAGSTFVVEWPEQLPAAAPLESVAVPGGEATP
ncbi:MAG TPA: HAMP domain-containing sensor histidine kinase [Kofleriaceae bacterium]|jgi:signal transduction histidine kinase